jgi:hypothetical protein
MCSQPDPPQPEQQQHTPSLKPSLEPSLSAFTSLPLGSHDVFAFLISLQPPLSDLLLDLTQLGFKDTNYIHGVANWSVDDQLAFLQQHGPLGDGRFTNLDIATLMIGFRRIKEGK